MMGTCNLKFILESGLYSGKQTLHYLSLVSDKGSNEGIEGSNRNVNYEGR